MKGRTPLHVASPQEQGWITYRRYAETMDALLRFGAQINAIDGYGETPLHRAYPLSSALRKIP